MTFEKQRCKWCFQDVIVTYDDTDPARLARRRLARHNLPNSWHEIMAGVQVPVTCPGSDLPAGPRSLS